VARMAEDRKLYTDLVGKPEGKRPFGRRRLWWEDGIRRDIREIGWRFFEWIQLAQNRGRWRAVVSAVMNHRLLALRCYLALTGFSYWSPPFRISNQNCTCISHLPMLLFIVSYIMNN
jgi:hypothetical protein